jgi:hypothetical protein
MPRKFSEAEINDIVRTARVQAPPFTAEEYQKLIQMQKEMADSKFIQAAWAVGEFEAEYGINCSEVLQMCHQLLKDRDKLESEIKGLRQRKEAAAKELAKTSEAARLAGQESTRLKKGLEATSRQVEQEKKRLKQEIEQARAESRISQEEVATARELKDEVEKHSLNLNLALRLCDEFARNKDTAIELTRAIEKYGSMQRTMEKFHSENETIKKEIVERQKESEELLVKCEQTRQQLSHLKSELGDETRVRNFWKRYRGSIGFLEYLAGWEQIHPLHCQFFTCGARFLVDQGPSNFRTKYVCPSCGLSHYMYDGEAAIKLGLPYGTPLKVRLGE